MWTYNSGSIGTVSATFYTPHSSRRFQSCEGNPFTPPRKMLAHALFTPSLPQKLVSLMMQKTGSPVVQKVARRANEPEEKTVLKSKLQALVLLSISLAAVSTFAPSAFAQTHRASVRGTVTDPNGAVVPGATVELFNVGTG